MTIYQNELNRRSTKRGKLVTSQQGGTTYQADLDKRFRRFLILGSELGSFYASDVELTKESAGVVVDMLDRDGGAVVDTIREVAVKGLAQKKQPLMFALAMAASHKNQEVRRIALCTNNFNAIIRTASDLFLFISYVTTMRGWGRALKRAVAGWYEDKSPEDLEYQLIKYRNRNGWTHADVMRLVHINPNDSDLYRWVLEDTLPERYGRVMAMESFKTIPYTPTGIANITKEYRLPREALPTQALNHTEVWEAMLDSGMPMQALVRNLGKISSLGMTDGFSDTTKTIVDQLTNDTIIQRSQVHPMSVATAYYVYTNGRGVLGNLTWTPSDRIREALNHAFVASFKNVTPSNKNIVLAIDSSGSMKWTNVTGNPSMQGLTAAQASILMAYITVMTEPYVETVMFDTRLRPYSITKVDSLNSLLNGHDGFCGGGTDLSLPFKHAQSLGNNVDAIVTFTDSQHGYRNNPHDYLARYRKVSGNSNVRFVLCQMTNNKFSLANPKDFNSMEVVGLDSSAPSMISSFIAGEI